MGRVKIHSSDKKHGLSAVMTPYEGVRVRSMEWDSVNQCYQSVRHNVSEPKILWTPVNPEGGDISSTTGYPSPENGKFNQPIIYIHPIHEFGKESTTEIFPALDEKNFNDYVLVFPADSGMPPIYVYFSKPYGETTAKGRYSHRPFNPDKAGGEILDLDWRTAAITTEGIKLVKLHISRFESSAANKVMIERLEKVLRGELTVTDTDKRFYTHEIRELERYRNLGISDGMAPPKNIEGEVWNNTHTAALEDYKINERTQELYTPEAEFAADNE